MILQRCSLSELTDRIVSRHHDYLRRQLPVLARLLAQVPPSPGLLTVRRLLDRFTTELEEHIFREEQILFPALKELEATGRPLPLGEAVTQMRFEHEQAREYLRSIRAAIDELPSTGALRQAVDALERDLYRHLALEECVLFPRAQALVAS